jgi:hypothetical protein
MKLPAVEAVSSRCYSYGYKDPGEISNLKSNSNFRELSPNPVFFSFGLKLLNIQYTQKITIEFRSIFSAELMRTLKVSRAFPSLL